MQYFVAANQSRLFILNAKEGEGSCKLSCSALASWKLKASKQGAGGELSPLVGFRSGHCRGQL